MKEKLFSLVLFTFTTTAAMAGASVSLGTPQQRYPWNGKMDIPYTLTGTDAAKYYSLVTTLTLGGTTKRVSRELGAGKDATYTNTVDCAALFGTNAVGEVNVKMSLEQYAEERAVGVTSVAKLVDLTKDEYLIIDLDNGSYKEIKLGDYLKTYPDAWSLATGWADAYKTQYLVMRKVAKNVPYPCAPGTSGTITGTKTPAKDYWIGVHQVTQEQYARVMGDNLPTRDNAKPKNGISWNMIRGSKGILESPDGFMSELTSKTGLGGFDLPTEAQWEIAARAGSAEEYGAYVDENGLAVKGTSDNIGDFAIYTDNSSTYGLLGAVGQLRPNLWGLYDTAGNVLEWCRDGWDSSFNRQDVESPSEGASSKWRVLRGGFYNSSADNCCPSFRLYLGAGDAFDHFGFRLSRICDPDAQDK